MNGFVILMVDLLKDASESSLLKPMIAKIAVWIEF